MRHRTIPPWKLSEALRYCPYTKNDVAPDVGSRWWWWENGVRDAYEDLPYQPPTDEEVEMTQEGLYPKTRRDLIEERYQ